MAKKLYIKTFGCQMNEYDSVKMADVLRESHGYELTDAPEAADLLLVNTCSIREKAQEKVFSELGRWRAIKERRDGVMIGVDRHDLCAPLCRWKTELPRVATDVDDGLRLRRLRRLLAVALGDQLRVARSIMAAFVPVPPTSMPRATSPWRPWPCSAPVPWL